MKQYFECHITMMGDPVALRAAVEDLRWKFSAIDGDPNLGSGVKCYATRQFSCERYETKEVLRLLEQTAGDLRARNIAVLREKIELVIHDTQSSAVQVTASNFTDKEWEEFER